LGTIVVTNCKVSVILALSMFGLTYLRSYTYLLTTQIIPVYFCIIGLILLLPFADFKTNIYIHLYSPCNVVALKQTKQQTNKNTIMIPIVWTLDRPILYLRTRCKHVLIWFSYFRMCAASLSPVHDLKCSEVFFQYWKVMAGKCRRKYFWEPLHNSQMLQLAERDHRYAVSLVRPELGLLYWCCRRRLLHR